MKKTRLQKILVLSLLMFLQALMPLRAQDKNGFTHFIEEQLIFGDGSFGSRTMYDLGATVFKSLYIGAGSELTISGGGGSAYFVVVGCLIAHLWYEITYGRDARNDTTLSENVRVNAYCDNTVRVWNQKDARYTTPKLSWVAAAPEHDSLTVFCDKEENYGYLNVNTGEIVIPARYKIEMASKDLVKAELSNNGECVMMDKRGHIVKPRVD